MILENFVLVLINVVEHFTHFGMRDGAPRLMECDHIVEPGNFSAQLRIILLRKFLHLGVVVHIILDLLPDGPLVILYLVKMGMT